MSSGRIHVIFGPNGTHKTSYALDDEEASDYYELEPGGWRRARAWVESHKRDVAIHPYRIPHTLLDQGEVIISARGGTAPAPVHNLQGWRKVWSDYLVEYVQNCELGKRKPVLDTGTRLWLLIRNAFQEQLQEATGSQRETLDQLRFTEPNSRMNQIMELPGVYGLDLIIICHEDTIWGTTQVKADGYKEMMNIADITLRFGFKDKKVVATVFKMGGAHTDIIGMEIDNPSIARVNQLLDAAETLNAMGMPFPDPLTCDGVIEMAEPFVKKERF